MFELTRRPRRLRYNQSVRSLVRENAVTLDNLIYPIFVKYGSNIKEEISAMPGQYQFSIDKLADEIKEIIALGIKAIIVFGIPEKKDANGNDSVDDNGIVQQAIRVIKKTAPDLLVISDVCLCQFTDHGHCGPVNDELIVANDATLKILAQQAVSHAKAGADMVAPSGMMDGMVMAIRQALDENGFYKIPVFSYAVKYRSAMYGPFGKAAEGAAKGGDRSTHQMDCANLQEAITEAILDIEEGADILMVKPAHTYLDVIRTIKNEFPNVPLGAYHVSGEYSMIKAAAKAGMIDEVRAMHEVLTSIKRAGADIIITYFAKDFARDQRNHAS